MSQQVLKDAALRAYYEAMFEMFATPGWRFLVEDVSAMHAANDTTAGLKTAEELHYRQGELAQMRWLMKLSESVEYAHNALLAEQEGGPEAPVSGGTAKVVE